MLLSLQLSCELETFLVDHIASLIQDINKVVVVQDPIFDEEQISAVSDYDVIV